MKTQNMKTNITYFKKNHTGLYNRIIKMGWFDLLEPYILNLTKVSTLELAKKFYGSSFSIEHSSEYHHARKFGYLDEVNVILANNKIEKRKKIVLENAKKYTGKNFSSDNSSDHQHACIYKYTNELNVALGKEARNYSKEFILNLARNFTGKSFCTTHCMEYLHAMKNFPEEYLEALDKPSKKRTLKIANFYVSEKKEKSFKRECRNEYLHAVRNGYKDELNKILNIIPKISKEKEKENVLNLARNFNKQGFSIVYKKEYRHAYQHGYIDEVKTILNKKAAI